MRKSLSAGLALAGLLAVAAVGAVTTLDSPARADSSNRVFPCPFPPCLAPCVIGAEPNVVCFTPGGQPEETTFACCCCGSSGKNRYRRL